MSSPSTHRQRIMPFRLNVFRIICKGATPTADEQAQIDEADGRGDFVICRLIMPHQIADDDAQEGGVYGNA